MIKITDEITGDYHYVMSINDTCLTLEQYHDLLSWGFLKVDSTIFEYV